MVAPMTSVEQRLDLGRDAGEGVGQLADALRVALVSGVP